MTNVSLRLLVVAGVLVMVVAALTSANRAAAAGRRVGLLEESTTYASRPGTGKELCASADADELQRAHRRRRTGGGCATSGRPAPSARRPRAQDPPHERATGAASTATRLLAGGRYDEHGQRLLGGCR